MSQILDPAQILNRMKKLGYKQVDMILALRKQAYIGVKLKAMKMSQTTLALMIGVANTTISAWNAGIQPARWSELDRVFPGFEAEANEWAKEQVKQNE